MKRFYMSNGQDAEDLQQYYEFVADAMLRALSNNKGIVFGNKSVEHANIVMNVVIKYAASEVCIFSRKMSGDVHSFRSILSALQGNSSLKLRVIVEDEPGAMADGSVLQTLLLEESVANRVAVRQIEPKKYMHFAVVDGKFVRVETDSDTRTAIVSFNESDIADQAQVKFDNLWFLSSPLTKFPSIAEFRC